MDNLDYNWVNMSVKNVYSYGFVIIRKERERIINSGDDIDPLIILPIGWNPDDFYNCFVTHKDIVSLYSPFSPLCDIDFPMLRDNMVERLENQFNITVCGVEEMLKDFYKKYGCLMCNRDINWCVFTTYRYPNE